MVNSSLLNIKEKNVSGQINFKWVITLFFVIMVFACGEKKVDKIPAIKDRASTPMMHATDITTIISDSGVTRFRITTPQWDDYDKDSPPHWEFPCGIHFEKFNEKLVVDANIHAQYAYYNKFSRLWELRGKVKATNLLGEVFETPQLFWNENLHKFYSDSTIRITQISQIATGVGFESDESMSRYTIKKYTGTFAVDENKTENATPTATSSPASATVPVSKPLPTPVVSPVKNSPVKMPVPHVFPLKKR